MSLLIFEGLDRTGKSTVAEHFKTKGFELIHQSAPAKGTTPDLFLEEMMQLVSSASGKDVVLDRSYYGELVWPAVYGRESLLSEENLEVLRELEQSVGTTKILMVDNNIEAHWKRCVDNNEPMTKPQFIKARTLFTTLVEKHGFARKTLQDWPELAAASAIIAPQPKPSITPDASPNMLKLTKEQIKLETANAINDVLSKRLLKSKGPIYDQLEVNIRTYLNTELGKIFGTKTEDSNAPFSAQEIELLKLFCKNLQSKAAK